MEIKSFQTMASIPVQAKASGRPMVQTVPAAVGANPRSSIHELAARYDIRNMTSVELRNMSDELIESGAIDFMDQRHMQLMAESPWAVERGAEGRITGIRSLGDGNNTLRRDYVQTQENYVAFLEQHGMNSDSAKKILDLFTRIDALRDGGVDATA